MAEQRLVKTEVRGGTISVFDGPPRALEIPCPVEEEVASVSPWPGDRLSEGVKPEEMAVFMHSTAKSVRARVAVEAAGFSFTR